MKALIDWVSLSISGVKNFDDFFTYFFLNLDDFSPCNSYNNYHNGIRHQSITVLYTAYDFGEEKYYNFFLNLSGQGCRQYETQRGKYFDWIEFIKNTQLAFQKYKFSRIDIALDFKDDSVPDMLKIIDYVRKKKYVSLFRRVVAAIGNEEWAFFGSPQSDTRLRIYNKALERGFTEGEKWIRFEYQLRNKSADRSINHLLVKNNIGQAFIDFINSSVRFTTKSKLILKGHEQDRLKTAPWWQKIIKNAGEIKKLDCPGIEYNYAKAYKYVDTQVAPTLYALLEANGGDISVIMDMMENNKHRLKDKHKVVIQDGLRILDTKNESQEKLEQLKKDLFGKSNLIECDGYYIINE